MAAGTPEMQAIHGFQERLGRLERQNRTLKLLVGALLVLSVVGQYRFEVRGRKARSPAPTTGSLVGTELILNDKDGYQRARISAGDGHGQLTLSDGWQPHGHLVSIDSTGIHIYQDQGGEQPVAELGGMGAQPFLQLWGSGKDSHRNIVLSAVEDPVLRITDESGFISVMGSTDLVTIRTGETHKTSAASLVLFGKDSKVLWSAP
jgi:hypothetical protein